MSIRMKAALGIILIVFAITAVNYVSSRYFATRSLLETMRKDQMLIRDLAIDLINTRINLLKADSAIIAKRLPSTESPEEMIAAMNEQLETHPEFLALAVFSPEDVVAAIGATTDPASFLGNSPYLDAAFKGKGVISTTRDEPLLLPAMAFHICVPMPNGKVLGVTISGLYFADLLAEYRLWKTGCIYIIDENGTMIAHYEHSRVLNRVNYIKQAETDPTLRPTAAFFRKMLSQEDGVGTYFFLDEERLCSYGRIPDSTLGWCLVVMAPVHESPKTNVQAGLFFAAALFLLVGSVAAVFLANAVVWPFSRIEEQNLNLKQLNETVRTQAAQIQAEHEQTKLLLDALPLSAQLWSKDGYIFDCNAETVKLFQTKDKQEFIDRFFELSPEHQPDGQRSEEMVSYYLGKAFEEGRCVFECTHQLLDGTLIPAEVTIVRVRHGKEDVAAAYARDLREHKQMMLEIERRDKLLNSVHRVATLLLTPTDDAQQQDSLMESLELLGRSIGADRVQIWRNEPVDGALYFVHRNQWLSEVGKQKPLVPIGLKFPYDRRPKWKSMFVQGGYLNCPVHELPEADQLFLEPYEINSIVIIPLFWQDLFWGFLSLDDCHQERPFSEEEINILRSAGLMIVSTIHRQILTNQIQKEHEHTQTLLDALPLGCAIWDKNLKAFDCNIALLHFFNLQRQEEFLDRFIEFAPEFQPDGTPSLEKLKRCTEKAFEDGILKMEWSAQTPDGSQIVLDTTLVRITYEGDLAVAAYLRDLSEHKRMMQAIGRRDFLLNTVNQIATALLESETNVFEKILNQCMDTMGMAVGVDRIYVAKNSVVGGERFFSKVYGWTNYDKPQSRYETEEVSYDREFPGWWETLSHGNCITGLVRDMPADIRERLNALNILSLCVVPIFLQDVFWGVISFDNHSRERAFSSNEHSILLSVGMLIANAIFRNDMMLNLRTAANQLEAALKEAKEATQAKSNFLAHISHEMRTPLNAVIGLSELALGADDLSGESHANLEKIYNAGVTLLNTVNDLLDLSKIEAGKFDLLLTEYDVPSLINDTITQNIIRIGDKPIEFVLDIDANLPTRLYGDELRIKQIFNNLLSNAFKYTKRGTVEFSVRCFWNSNDMWLIARVSDTGIGIRPEDLAYLFTEYSQMDVRSSRYIEGTGLGLSIAKQLAEMMDGSISVETEFGKGSEFTVKVRQKLVTDAVIGQEMVESLKNFQYADNRYDRNLRFTRLCLPYARVLVVDDIVTNLDVAKGLLKPYRMFVRCVTSGVQAVDAIRDEKIKYNAIFMDHMMSGMNGVEATRQIREIGTEYAKNIPIIAMTANAVSGNEEMFLSNGFQAFLPKPIDLSRLNEIIRLWVWDKTLETPPTGLGGRYPRADKPDRRSHSDRRYKSERRIFSNRRNGRDRRMLHKRIAGVDMLKGIKLFGNEQSFLRVLQSFATNTRPLLETIKQVDQDDWDDYIVAVHGVKGSSRGICAEMVGTVAETLEMAAKSGEIGFVLDNTPDFLQTVDKLITDIENYVRAVAEESPKPKRDRPDAETLAELLAACDSYDMDGVDAAMAKIEDYEYDDGLADWLRENVDQMNFEQMTEKLKEKLNEPDV